MERKCRKICNTANGFSVPLGPKCMSCISQNRDATNGSLNGIGRHKKFFFAPYNFKNAIIVAGNTRQIHRNDGLGFGSDPIAQLIIIHLKGILLGIHQHRSRTHMTNDRSCGSIGVCSGDDFVTGADTQHPQSHFRTCSLGIQAHCPIDTAISCHLTFQFLGSGTRCDPAGAQRIGYFLDLQFRNIRRRKGNIHKSFRSCLYKG